MITNRQIIEIIETNEYYKNLLTMLSMQKVVGESLIDDKVVNSARTINGTIQSMVRFGGRMINIFLTLWITCYCLFVIIDNTPCDNNIRKVFLFLTSFVVHTAAIAVIWHKELIALIGGN